MGRLIDADALDNAFTELRFNADGELAHWGDRKDWCLHGNEIEKLIADAPTVDAEPVRHGHWTSERNPMMYQLLPYVWVCDQCGTAFYYKTPYCGECGAKMDEEEK